MTATVLIVDDLESNLKLLEAKLLAEYYTVYSATSGAEALKILSNTKIDVVLLDVMMPGMDGLETCQLIKANKNTAHIPVIIITALSDVEDKVRGLEAGADDFLTKPIQDIPLFARVKSLVRMKTIIDQIRLRSMTYAQMDVADSGPNNLYEAGAASMAISSATFQLNDEFSEMSILIIDDEDVWAKRIRPILMKLTKKVELFECINYIKNKNLLLNDLDKVATALEPDLLIISNQIILEDPLRVYAVLRSKDELKHSAFIIVIEDLFDSSNSDDIDTDKLVKGLEMGINDFIPYSIDDSELLAKVKTQLRRKKYQDQLKQDLDQKLTLVTKDSLLNIFNRRYFDSHINQLIVDTQESSKLLFLMMIDLDYFKRVNDVYGHQVGDEILKTAANIMENNIRVTDLLARYGGEEFVISIYNSDIDQKQILIMANRIREKFEHHHFIVAGINTPLKQTVSIGITQYIAPESASSFIERADKALYNSKHNGRNQICIL